MSSLEPDTPWAVVFFIPTPVRPSRVGWDARKRQAAGYGVTLRRMSAGEDPRQGFMVRAEGTVAELIAYLREPHAMSRETISSLLKESVRQAREWR